MNKPEIFVRHGVITKLALDTGCSTTTVRSALRGATNSPKVDLIRKRAIEVFGGVKEKKGR